MSWVVSSSLIQETATTFSVVMEVKISFVLSGFMLHPLTWICLKILDFGQLRGTWVVISQVQSLCMCSPLLSVYLQLEHCMRNVRVDPMASLSPKIPDHFFSSELALFINFLKMLFLWSWGKRMGQPEFSLNSLIFKEFFWLWFYHLVSFLVVS